MDADSISIDQFKSKRDFKTLAIDKTASICSGKNNVIVSIYDFKKDQFLFCSDSLKKKLGYFPSELIKGGWKFWADKIKPSEAPGIVKKINAFIRQMEKPGQQNPIFLAYHLKSRWGEWHHLKHEITKYRLQDESVLFNFLYDNTQHALINSFFGITENRVLQTDGTNAVLISKRENEVLILLADGYSSKQIANQLYISTHTVVSHRKNLIEKFGVKNTPQLINKATRLNSI